MIAVHTNEAEHRNTNENGDMQEQAKALRRASVL